MQPPALDGALGIIIKMMGIDSIQVICDASCGGYLRMIWASRRQAIVGFILVVKMRLVGHLLHQLPLHKHRAEVRPPGFVERKQVYIRIQLRNVR